MPTLTEMVKALGKARADVARLSREIVYDLGLSGGLPIATIQSLPAPRRQQRKKRKYTLRVTPAPAAGAKAVAVPGKPKRKRVKVTDALRNQVMAMHTTDKLTAYAISNKLGIAFGTAKRIIDAKK